MGYVFFFLLSIPFIVGGLNFFTMLMSFTLFFALPLAYYNHKAQ